MATSSFAALLRQHRLAVGLTQEELAERAGLSGRAISDLERGLKLAPRPSTVRLLVRGLGLPDAEAAALLRAAQQPREAVPDTRPGPARHTLPLTLSSFVGRERELADLTRLVGSARLVTLTGAGGAGKTRLALEIAATLAERHRDGVWFVDLAPLSDAALVPQAAVVAVGAREAPGRDPQAALLDHLRGREMLLILDNCEHVVDAAAHLANALVRACPGVRALATSRERLGVAGEVAWRVPSLSLPAEGAEFAEVADSEAVRLFIDRARLVRPDFGLDAANVAAVRQVCRRLDGMPLAIELAAARLRVLSVGEIAARLDDRFALLTGGSRTALRRQQTLRAAVDWSHDLLAPQERALFRRLAIFAGGWTLEAAEAVCAGGDVAAEDVLDLLARLVDTSLVEVHETVGGATRYRLLETLRQYALERLAESGEVETMGARHTDYFVAFAQHAQSASQWAYRGPGAAWLRRLQAEQSNLRTAMQRCVATRDVQRGLALGGAVAPSIRYQGSPSEGRDWLDQLVLLLQAGRPEPTLLRARALYGAGVLATTLFDYTFAQTLLEENLAIRRQLGAPLATALQELGSVAWRQGEYTRAQSVIGEAVEHARAEGNRTQEGAALRRLGQVVEEVGDLGRASSLYADSRAVYRQVGYPGGVADAVGGLGCVALAQGDLDSAQALFEESLALAHEINDEVTIAWGCLQLALVWLERGEWAKAGELLAENLQARGYLQDQRRIPRSLAGLARVAAMVGHPARAMRLFGAAMALREATHRPRRAWAAPPFDAASIDSWEPAARAALGEEAAASAFAAGAALSLEEAVAYALEASASTSVRAPDR